MDEQRRRGPAATQVEATGQHVRDNVTRLRKARGLTTYQLAQRLAEIGRPIPQSGISRIESGARRVDVDDLAALAIALGVSPSALLLPLDDDPSHAVEVTGAGSVPADVAWDWADGTRPLLADPRGLNHTEALEFDLYSRPPRRRRSWEAMQDLITSAEGRAADVVRGLRKEDPKGGSDG
jgi:transcriptional regulator with XRE-family HTH domain